MCCTVNRVMLWWCVVSVITVLIVNAQEEPPCNVFARVEAGKLCGIKRVLNTTNSAHSIKNREFASFLGVPYAEQPVGERRFSELKPLQPWDGFYHATKNGPICPQHDVLFREILAENSMSEACIYANIHVPVCALPLITPEKSKERSCVGSPGLPILLFAPGGGFSYGGGGTDLYGAEYLMNLDIIVITINYRLNVFGFMSLNSSSIPGNNGLRDIATALHWVSSNAKYFGGNPEDITLGGESASAAAVHLLSLSKTTNRLFKRLILMSGAGLPSFYTTSPVYAANAAKLFLSQLGVNATDPEQIHRELIATPLDDIMSSYKHLQDSNPFGIVFFPVVESQFAGVTRILDADPEVLLYNGIGKDIPILAGYNSDECETFRGNLEEFDMLAHIRENPIAVLSPSLVNEVSPEVAQVLADRTINRYFEDYPTMDKYVKSCSDLFFVYPLLKLAEVRSASSYSAPLYLYQFAYQPDFSPIREANRLNFKGAGHVEDLQFLFRATAMDGRKGYSPPSHKDQLMVNWMTTLVNNFMYCSNPICQPTRIDNSFIPKSVKSVPNQSGWPAVSKEMPSFHQLIAVPMVFNYTELPTEQQEMKVFIDGLYQNNT